MLNYKWDVLQKDGGGGGSTPSLIWIRQCIKVLNTLTIKSEEI